MSEMTMSVVGRREATGVDAVQMARWVHWGPAPMIIDVRSPAAFARRHVADAINVPEGNAAALVESLPYDGLVVLVCDDGSLSHAVARTLAFCGFRQVTWLEGGMKSWLKVEMAA